MSRSVDAVIPAKAGIQMVEKTPRSGQKHGVASLREKLFNQLDSRLRGNDE